MKTQVIVGLGSCGIAAGAGKVYDVLLNINKEKGADFSLSRTSCIGMCYREPLVEVIDERGSVIYGNIDEEKAREIVTRHLINKEIIEEWIVRSDKIATSDDTFFSGQIKIALRNCGIIDPEKIEEYEKMGGYKSLEMIAVDKIPSEKVVQMVIDSGLRGRGGGGFPTGLKWKLTLNSKSDEKYIICNADEGDPGAFMDRSLLEGDPHSVLEGMIIGAYAVKASEGVIYCRAEYPLAIKRLNIAITQAREKGYLGKNIAGITGFNFDLFVKEGAGAFVCGEETALMASVEGKRGMPYKKPPFPAESGLWRKPTNINNVETWANIPWIISNGPEKYAAYGTEKSKGTKVFALTGKIRRGGLVEVPMGITLREIIYELGGGIQNDRRFKAVQMGGPSGGCIPAALIDTIIDYESVTSTGAIMGSGGMVVMDETTCMVDIARFFLDFTYKESCGKCTFCRVGTKRMLEILTRICEGEGKESDLELLEELAVQIKDSSLCGLGQTAPNPVLTTLKYFRNEYLEHIVNKKCPAGICTKLLTYEVVPDKCTGCTVCAKNCPVNAISGERKQVHLIDQAVCIKCGVCFTKCTFDAIRKY
ncbi:MAG: NADH-quinone oxidoreductase subunit NuoF [Bacteroidales bacterium]|jgi:NADH-quinone oxidoreductase subunit F|nr:NADH-quinone oxidoreductase subunit NuoF [Bacteroidales bacterium]